MNRRGFTLIEVLIAVSIMVMISTLIFTAFSSLQRSRDGIRRVSERYREGRMALTRISHELEGAYVSKHLPINLNIQAVNTVFKGVSEATADRLDFNAFVHRRLDRDVPESDQAEISYFGLDDPVEDGKLDLIRRSNPRLDMDPELGGRGQVLARDIDLFDLRYLDPLVGEWVEEWDSSASLGQFERLPLQVHVTLVLNGGGRISQDSSHSTVSFTTKISLPMQAALTFATQ